MLSWVRKYYQLLGKEKVDLKCIFWIGRIWRVNRLSKKALLVSIRLKGFVMYVMLCIMRPDRRDREVLPSENTEQGIGWLIYFFCLVTGLGI